MKRKEEQYDAVKAYLDEIGNKQLLTAEEEIRLGNIIQPRRKLMRKIAFRGYYAGRKVKDMLDNGECIGNFGNGYMSKTRKQLNDFVEKVEQSYAQGDNEAVKKYQEKLNGVLGKIRLGAEFLEKFADSMIVDLIGNAEEIEKRTMEKPEYTMRKLETLASAMSEYRTSVNEFVSRNLRLVVPLAKIFRKPYEDITELIQEGNKKLFDAVKCFKPSMGFKFSTYAYDCLKNFYRLRRNKTEEYRTILDIPVFNNQLITETYKEQLPDENTPSSYEVVSEVDDREVLGTVYRRISTYVAGKSPRERKIMEMYFGLNGDRKSLSQIGTEVKLTKQMVGVIKDKVLEDLIVKFRDLKTPEIARILSS